MSAVSRSTVLILLFGAAAAAASVARRERPRAPAALALLVNVVLIGLFWRLRFHALGFDQDSRAPR